MNIYSTAICKRENMTNDEFACDCDVIHADVVNLVKKHMPDDEEFTDLSAFFKILGDYTRTKILWALDKNEMCVCDLASLLNMTKSAVSHQLRLLRIANLVKSRRDGKVIFYSLADDHVKAIFETGHEHIREM